MKTIKTLLLAFAVFGLCSTALAAEFEDNFESYAAGSQMHGQNGWHGWNGDAAAGAPCSDAFAYSGNNSVEIISTADLVHQFDVSGGQWVYSTMMYIPSGSTGTTYFILLNTYSDNGTQDWSVQTLFDLAAGTLSSYYVSGSSADIVYDEWVELKIAIDLDNNTVDEYYNGVLFATHQWDDGNSGTLQCVDLYGNSASSVYYDDIVLETLEESQAAADNPVPANGTSDVARADTELSWTAGSFAVAHDVYFGADMSAVVSASRTAPMGVLVSQNQTGTTYVANGLLEFGQDYYWRIDEVRQDGTIDEGPVWTFTAETFSYVIEDVIVTTNGAVLAGQGPENTVNGSGLNEEGQHSADTADMWLTPVGGEPTFIQFEFDRIYQMYEMNVWNHNFLFEMVLGLGAKDVTIEYSVDGAEWTILNDVVFDQAPGQATYTGQAINLDSVAAKFIRLNLNSNYGGPQVGLSEVRFYYTPAHVRYPNPADGATNVDVTTTLSWRPGRDAVSHDVYLSTDPDALELAATTTDKSYDSGGLDLATKYYWQVNEVNQADAVSVWEGDLWSFTTEEYIVVDDFEAYNDDIEAGTTIWQGWVDGIDDPTNGGAVVGNAQSPFAEQTIVRSGQSMNLSYSNSSASATSEADHTLSPAQNWTANGVKTLSLWFRGTTGNTGKLYVKINNTKVTYDGPATDIGIAGWQKWNIVLAGTGANLNNVTSLSIGVEGAGSGIVYIDDIHLSPKISGSLTSDIEIAISAQANWWSQAAADREIEKIVDKAQAPVVVFGAGDEEGLADWLIEHTGNGEANLLILCGKFPDSIYPGANAEPDGSLAELFLDDGNTIINTGDWIFYVGSVSNNSAAGLQNMMDIPGVTVAGGDNTPVTVTAEGQEFTPSLQNFATDRPFHLDTLAGDWSTELVLAQTADGLLADPVVVRNSATGGRIGIFHQAAGEDNLPRGEVISEWINNWYLDAAGN